MTLQYIRISQATKACSFASRDFSPDITAARGRRVLRDEDRVIPPGVCFPCIPSARGSDPGDRSRAWDITLGSPQICR